MSTTRLERRLAELARQERGAFITFTTAGDPDPSTSAELLAGLPAAGADVIELGMPFSDPMADGPSIQASSQRALKAGMTLARTLEMVADFRTRDQETPVILMGYYNPIYRFGPERFVAAAVEAGIDGLIVVDLPPEEDSELCLPARRAGLHWIRLATPTTDEKRLPKVLTNASGFIYYVSILGITGTKSATREAVQDAVERLKRHTGLPIAVGFGIRTPEQATAVAQVADATVVGSALVDTVTDCLDNEGKASPELCERVLSLVRSLADAAHTARTAAKV